MTTKETNPTRPGSPTPCKQALRELFFNFRSNKLFHFVLLHAGKIIAHFTVTGGNEAGVDLVLIQPLLLYYVSLMLTSVF